MKFLGPDGYLEPRKQIWYGVLLAPVCLVNGLWSLLKPSSPLDTFFGVCCLLAVPSCICAAWYGARKLKRLSKPPQ